MHVMWQPPDPAAFNDLVWKIARQVPPGYVTTYGQIASMIPPSEDYPADSFRRLAPRWVGRAMSLCPDDVPWQRVINSQGRISLRDEMSAGDRQRAMLEAEGVEFDASERVDFDQVGWHGPPDEWLAAHNLLAPRLLGRSSSGGGEQLGLF